MRAASAVGSVLVLAAAGFVAYALVAHHARTDQAVQLVDRRAQVAANAMSGPRGPPGSHCFGGCAARMPI